MLTHLNCQSYYLGNFFITLREWTLECFSMSMSKNYMVMCLCRICAAADNDGIYNFLITTDFLSGGGIILDLPL